MTITLTPEQQSWLESQVAAGRYPSIEDAVRVAVADLKTADSAGTDDDLEWAKPYVDEAREAVARGGFITLDEHRARMAKHLQNLED